MNLSLPPVRGYKVPKGIGFTSICIIHSPKYNLQIAVNNLKNHYASHCCQLLTYVLNSSNPHTESEVSITSIPNL